LHQPVELLVRSDQVFTGASIRGKSPINHHSSTAHSNSDTKNIDPIQKSGSFYGSFEAERAIFFHYH